MHSSFFNICYIKFCLRGHTTPTNVRGHKQILVRPSTTKYECTFVFFSFIFFLFFFYIFFFFFFSFIFVPFYYTSNLNMRTTKSWLYVSKHKFRLVQHHQQTFSLLFIVPDKAFLHIPVTNWNLFLFAGEYISVHSSKEPPIIELENMG